MTCKGNALEYCGGSKALQMYNNLGAISSSTTASPSASSSAPTSTSSSLSSSTSSSSSSSISSSTTSSQSSVSSSAPSSTSLSSSSSTTTSTSTTASPTQTGLIIVPSVGAYSYVDCYTEATTGRALSSKTYANDSMTIESCAAFSLGYTWFGVEYQRECKFL
jgi:iron transport multicopper oxidase